MMIAVVELILPDEDVIFCQGHHQSLSLLVCSYSEIIYEFFNIKLCEKGSAALSRAENTANLD